MTTQSNIQTNGKGRVLPDLTKEVQANADLITQLKAQVAQLEAEKARRTTITCKVSAKGAVSVYGMGRWPVTLYGSQWATLEKAMPSIMRFIDTNRSQLATKE